MSNPEQTPSPPLYLRDVWLENAGPIEKLDLTLPFNQDGTPKPLVIVGGNGAGKTILLSYVADALIEMAKTAFNDVVPGMSSISRPYLRINGGVNQNSSAEFGLGLLHFSIGERQIVSVEKSGKCDSSLYNRKLTDYMGSDQILGWPLEGNHKSSVGGDEKFYEDCFSRSSICFFPANRSEAPHWLNRESLFQEDKFFFDPNFAKILSKPLVVEQTAQQNKQWLLDVMLDSRSDVEPLQIDENTLIYVALRDINEIQLLKLSRRNVERLLKGILQRDNVSLGLNYRSRNPRLFIAKEGKLWLPSLDHLSAGQAILFNLFATIIRYSDRTNVAKSFRLHEIEGIVLIDEIDAHLHADLQHEVLPTLMQLFPRVQFIVTTHSPLFLLGMEKTYGSDGFVILDMPSGQQITTERFGRIPEVLRLLQRHQNPRKRVGAKADAKRQAVGLDRR